MAAATVSASEHALFLNKLAEQLVSVQSSHDLALHGRPIPFKMKFDVATTNIDDADDILRLVTFPAGWFLLDFDALLSDMDTHATPTLEGRFVILNSSDVEQFDVTAQTASGETGGGVSIAAGVKGRYVGGMTLAWKTNLAAATPAAGTITGYFLTTFGIVNEANDVPMTQSY